MTTIITREGDTITIESENLITVFKHNDVGVSIDYYKKESNELFGSDAVWFGDLEEDEN